VGEGSSAAYLVGVLKALFSSSVRCDLLVGRGVGALVAAFAAISAESRLFDENGLFDSFEVRRPFELRPPARVALVLVAVAFAAFAAPLALAIAAVVVLPVALLLIPGSPGVANTSSGADVIAAAIVSFLRAAEPLYLRAIALPVAAVFVAFLVLWGRAILRGGGLQTLAKSLGVTTPPFTLDPLRRKLVELLWQAVRGTSTEARPVDASQLSLAYTDMLEGNLGHGGFRELILYALDVDSGRENRFVLLKERYLKRWCDGVQQAGARERDREPIDLSREGKELLFDVIVAAASPLGLAHPVEIPLPLGTKAGGEVHGFVSSVVGAENAVADAIAAGAEQVLYVTSFMSGEALAGGTWERAGEISARLRLEQDMRYLGSEQNVPIFVIRPDRVRRSAFEFAGRARGALAGRAAKGKREGEEAPVSLRAVVAQGERDASRLFVRPALGVSILETGEQTIPITGDGISYGPREL
jgi:hypothetical protein